MTGSYRNLVVWQKAMIVVKNVYILTKDFPRAEQFGLVSQMRRSAVSIPANIAEGKMRNGDREFSRFLQIAFGSGAELETHLEIAKELEYVTIERYILNLKELQEVMKMINALLSKLKANG